MAGYFILFASALVAATVLPMQSEAVLVALLIGDAHAVWILIGVATVGNVLGSVINWGLGRFIEGFRGKPWFPASAADLARAQDWYRRYGRWSLLGSWLPIIGDPLTVVAGVMREPIVPFLILVTLSKAGRYVALAALTLAWI